ncbi:ABC transporter ATP-binding protein [Algibacillus agarilyticus]|uniref:ABC transporter ATP-binding protein n=1 Tax=Algibacillus agarilyticus TaxID=2234133 RepID=UPI000DCF64E9|nr:ABC transporter ATP-binding protein [Algibacillus agarilyticus]
MTSIVSVKNIHLHYGQQKVLSGVDFTLNKGEILCLLGPSGCGKTTILKSVAGLLPISAGTIEINNKVVSRDNEMIPAEKRNLGMLFQDYALFPHLTVTDNITYGLRGLNKNEKQQRLTELLTLVHLDGNQHKYPHQLSGGQQQRVALARALAYKPDLLLLDEPFSNIDTKVKFELIDQVRDIIKQENVAAIFVSHSKEEAYAFADKVALLNQGKVEQLDAPDVLYKQPKSLFVANFMGALNSFKLATLPDYLHAKFNCEAHDMVSFRPEHIKLSPMTESAVIKAQILKKRFVGSHYQITVKHNDTALLVLTDKGEHYEPLQWVNINLQSEKAILFN